MYLEFGTEFKDPNFSYIICKNPNNPAIVEKHLGSSIIVRGKFKNCDHKYVVTTETDPLEFLRIAKLKNLDNYINPYISDVTPMSIKCIEECLRSALRGTNSSGGQCTDQQIVDLKDLHAVIGPFSIDKEIVISMFENFGMNCNVSNVGIDTKYSNMFHIKGKDISISEFLQKIYIASYILTFHLNTEPLDENSSEKLRFLTSKWIKDVKIDNKLFKYACRKNKHIKSVFQEYITDVGLISDNEEEKINANKRRRDFVVDKIRSCNINNVFDIGCSHGNLAIHMSNSGLSNINYYGIDVNKKAISSCRRHSFKNDDNNIFKFDISNALSPKIDRKNIKIDLLTCVEMIEHLNKTNRDRILYLIKQYYVPEYIILTTPNYSYNKNFDDLVNGDVIKYRHRDHKIEYTEEEFKSEVIDALSSMYDVEIIKLNPNEEEQLTFCIFCKHKDYKNAKISDVKFEVNDKIYLPLTNYIITNKEIEYGLCEIDSNSNMDNLFYLSPSISPVEYDPSYPEYLEHPMSAINYYKRAGIKRLICEYKYMGSRIHILAFKDPKHAELFGYKHSVTAISRKGFDFFNNMEHNLDLIHEDLKHYWEDTGNEFVIIDGECMPWSLKANRLITDYMSHGESVLLDRTLSNRDTSSVCEFLTTVKRHSMETDLIIRAFHILACGKIDADGVKFVNYKNGYTKDHIYNITESMTLSNKIIKTFGHMTVDTTQQGFDELIDSWESYCNNGGEGFVIKPYEFFPIHSTDYPIQPALKVRGRKYLRMVYGVDYLNGDYFDIVKMRNISKKRVLAAREHELSRYILSSFLKGNSSMHKKYLAAFIGMENLVFSGVDKTL